MIIREVEKNDTALDEFRLRILTEEKDSQMKSWFSFENWKNVDRKILSVFHNDEIVGVSCERKYKKYIRIGTPQYILKEYRNVYRNSLLRPGGFMSHHLQRNNNQVFFSIHLYSSRMKFHAENFYKRRIAIHGSELLYIDDVKWLGNYIFHGVEQSIFSYGINDTEDLLNTILS